MLLGLAHRVFHEAKRRSHERKIFVVRRDTAQKAWKLLNRDEHDALRELAARFGQGQNHRESLPLFVSLNRLFDWPGKEVQSGGSLVLCCKLEFREIARSIPVFAVHCNHQIASEPDNVYLPSSTISLHSHILLGLKPSLQKTFFRKFLELLPRKSPSRISQPSSPSDIQSKSNPKSW